MIDNKSPAPQSVDLHGALIFILLMLFIRVAFSAYFAFINFTGDGSTLGLFFLFGAENFSEVPMNLTLLILLGFLSAQIILGLDLFLLLKFIAKSRKWTIYFTAISIINLAIILLGAVAVKFLLGNWPDTKNMIVGNLAFSAGIIQYMLTSERATSTFVN
jgi:Protein of unknown function (DUF2569)